MTMSIADLTTEIEQAKADFNAAKRRLSATLAPAMPALDAESMFLAYVEEFSIEKALEDSQADPDNFDLGGVLHPGLAEKLRSPLSDANEAHQRVIDLVAKRDRLIRREDPSHAPTYYWNGREFSIDAKRQTMTYLDTGEVHGFVHEAERPRAPEGKGRSR
jgi:hypothetical protein